MENTPTRQIFNAITQQVEEATMTVDHNNEIIATFADGNFVKFPAGLTKEQFEQRIERLCTNTTLAKKLLPLKWKQRQCCPTPSQP